MTIQWCQLVKLGARVCYQSSGWRVLPHCKNKIFVSTLKVVGQVCYVLESSPTWDVLDSVVCPNLTVRTWYKYMHVLNIRNSVECVFTRSMERPDNCYTCLQKKRTHAPVCFLIRLVTPSFLSSHMRHPRIRTYYWSANLKCSIPPTSSYDICFLESRRRVSYNSLKLKIFMRE
jgi:uncharacterized membrane protein